MTTKIIQIMDAPPGLEAYYTSDGVDEDRRTTAFGHPVICLALVETADSTGTYNEVRAMVISPDTDTMEFAQEISGFLALVGGNS